MPKVSLTEAKNIKSRVVRTEVTERQIVVTMSVEEAACLAALTGITARTGSELNFGDLYKQLASALNSTGGIFKESYEYRTIYLRDHLPNLTIDDINFDRSLLNKQARAIDNEDI